MIIIIEGLGVGAGKSFLTLTKLMVHFCAGGTAYVVDTFQLKWDNVKKYCFDHYGYILEDDQYRSVSEDKILEIHKHTAAGTDDCPVVIVLDEVQGQLNARDWNDTRRKDLFAWACQSRHDSNDVWFISQHSANIDKQVRRLATYTFKVRNTRMWGKHIITNFIWVANKLTFGIAPKGYFVVKQLDSDGKTPLGKRKWLEQDPELFNCYISKSMSGKHLRGGEVIPKRKLARKQTHTPWFRWAVAAVLVTALFVAGCKFIPGRKEPAPSTAASASSASAASSTPSKPPYDVRSEKFRSQWDRRGETYRLATEQWIYERGRLCPDGMVDQIQEGQVRIKQADGRWLFVLGDKRPDPSHVRPVAASPTPGPGLITIAPDSMHPPGITAAPEPIVAPSVRPLR